MSNYSKFSQLKQNSRKFSEVFSGCFHFNRFFHNLRNEMIMYTIIFLYCSQNIVPLLSICFRIRKSIFSHLLPNCLKCVQTIRNIKMISIVCSIFCFLFLYCSQNIFIIKKYLEWLEDSLNITRIIIKWSYNIFFFQNNVFIICIIKICKYIFKVL